MTNQMDCKAAMKAMPDLLFDPGAAPAAAAEHVRSCDPCSEELASLQRTMLVLDSWEAPEPSLFWVARMGARLREEQAQPARGWAGVRERMRTRFWLSNHSLRPAVGVAALALLVAAGGGGTWLELSASHPAPVAAQASNTVQDLQSLNENAQVFQQLSALDAPDESTQSND